MTEMEPTDSVTRPRRFSCARASLFRSTRGAAPPSSPAFRQNVIHSERLWPAELAWLHAAALESLPVGIGFHFSAAQKEDPCVAFRQH